MKTRKPEEITLSFYYKGRILSINVAIAEEIDELDPGDPEACSEFVELVKDALCELREGAKNMED